MKPRLKELSRQTIVLTGATSGIGLVTARQAASRGARLVLAARNEAALRRLADELAAAGARVAWAVTDVGDFRQVQRLADVAQHHFGGIDTWINNAGVSIYGRLTQVPLEDHRRLFETNFWGVVHGSLVAIEHLRRRPGGAGGGGGNGGSRGGGALINIGSALSDRSIPLQGMYSASKAAVKGFTDALRMEVEEEGLPISISLVKPSAIDTPYLQHARNYLDVEPKNPAPVYAPELVARAILRCAQRPIRDITIGAAGAALGAAAKIAPRLTDRYMELAMFRAQKTRRPSRPGRTDSLRRPGEDLRERGGYPGAVLESSPYTAAVLNPALASAAVLGTGLAAAAAWRILGGHSARGVIRPLITGR